MRAYLNTLEVWTQGNVSATCRGCVIFVFLPEELTNYVKMPTGFFTWFWALPLKKIKMSRDSMQKSHKMKILKRLPPTEEAKPNSNISRVGNLKNDKEWKEKEKYSWRSNTETWMLRMFSQLISCKFGNSGLKQHIVCCYKP